MEKIADVRPVAVSVYACKQRRVGFSPREASASLRANSQKHDSLAEAKRGLKPAVHLSTIFLALVLAPIAAPQGTTPRASAAEYPVHTEVGKLTLGAEYLVHSIPTVKGVLVSGDYLAIEVALFGPSLTAIEFRADHFHLRINGDKYPLMTQSPGMVAASMKYPDWEQRKTVTASAGSGNGNVIYGPQAAPRFPGDPAGRQIPIPRPPEPENRSGQEREPSVPLEEQIQKLALPEGKYAPPLAGLVFFPFRGKMKSIKSLELLYEGPAGKATLKLF
jgi:hypothetical protein